MSSKPCDPVAVQSCTATFLLFFVNYGCIPVFLCYNEGIHKQGDEEMKQIIAILLASTMLTGCCCCNIPLPGQETEQEIVDVVPTYALEIPDVTLPVEETEEPEYIMPTEPATVATEPAKVLTYGMATISASDYMNIRSGPGTSYSIAGEISSGKRVEIYEIVYSEGMVWGRFHGGWLCLDYVRLDDASQFPLSEQGTWYVLARRDSVPIYQGPGKQYARVGSYSKDTVVEVKGVAGQWYLTEDGWASTENFYYHSSG